MTETRSVKKSLLVSPAKIYWSYQFGNTKKVVPVWYYQKWEQRLSENKSRVEKTFEVLRNEILLGQYRQGERLPSERDLSARFDVTRSAVRESIKKLEQLGIASVTPGGVRVLPIEDATLEILGPLLDLGEIQKIDLIVQFLEVFG